MPDPELSNRELDVLRLLATGKSNAEIAAELFIGVETVKSHLSGIYRRLGVARRGEAVAWITARRGLLYGPDTPIARAYVEAHDSTVDVRFVGEFDMTTAGLMADALAEARRQASGCVRLDMGEVGFVDSAALRELVVFFAEMPAPDAMVVEASPSFRRLVAYTGLEAQFGMSDE